LVNAPQISYGYLQVFGDSVAEDPIFFREKGLPRAQVIRLFEELRGEMVSLGGM
jgi:hypothetical protein